MGSVFEKLRKAYEAVLADPKPKPGDPGPTLAIDTVEKTGTLSPTVNVGRVADRLATSLPEVAGKIQTAPFRPDSQAEPKTATPIPQSSSTAILACRHPNRPRRR